MFARLLGILGKVLVKTPAKIILGLVAFYFLFAWFGFEPLVKWAAPKYIADKSKHTLSIAEARFDPLALTVSVKGLKLAEPDGKPLLGFGELFVDFEAASLFKWAYTFDTIRLAAPDARLELRPDGSLNWTALIEALKSKEDEPDKPLPRLLIHRVVLEKGRVGVADRKVGFETALNPLDLTLTELSTLPDDKGAYTLAATTQLGARIRWKGDMTLKPIVATGELAVDGVTLAKLWPYVQDKLAMAPPEGFASLSLAYRAGYADKKLSLLLDKLGLSLEGLGLKGKDAAEPSLTLDRLALSGGRFDLDKRQLDIGEIALSGGKVALNRDKAGRLDVLDWFPPSPTVQDSAVAAKPAPAPKAPAKAGGEVPPWRVNLNRFALNGLGIRVTDAGFAAPLTAEVGNVQVGFAAKAEAGATTQAVVEGLAVDVSGLRLLSAAMKEPLFVLGGLTLADGHLDLAARQAEIGRVSVANGKLEAVRDGKGRIALLEALKPVDGKSSPAAAPAKKAEPAAADTWHWKVGQVDLSGFQVAARDETVQPAGGLTLDKIEATASGLSDNLKAPLPVKLGFQVKEGGSFQAEGKVVPAAPSADIRLKLANLALAPAQPWLTQAANLTLASGRASLHGQVKYAGKAEFKGGFEVADLLLNESEGGARFLAWKQLASDSVSASQEALDIDELKLDSLGMKLVIYQDKTVNLKKILKAEAPPPEPNGQLAGGKAAEPAKPGEAAAGKEAKPLQAADPAPAYRMNIDRIRIEHGEMDFADLSLALPFGTRIHDFKGAFNGISTKPGSAAELELDGRVDDYGLARAVGQLDLFNPTGFMDIKTVFRNVEMTNLTPYTATFVGRKIQSGKLSLDLEYKIKDRQLLGQNQIVMDKLTLGERVESPTAKDLPLDLAIAILQDSDGKIDLGLPVSGSLDDPQFSYGQIIWKAIGNIITKIVTAPFRALGALFGGGGEKLEKVAFEAGEAGLTPPEKEKFKQIAQILAKRPGLALTVQGAWSAEIDRPAMKELQLRRAVAEKMGVKLAPDEDPGPISTANPKAQAALETLYAARFGEPEWKVLSGKWLQANPEKKKESTAGKMVSRLKNLFKPEEPLSAEDLGQLKDADLHALLYKRLLDKEAVSDEALGQLARRRGLAVVDGLVAAGAPAERVKAADIVKHDGDGREVPAKLELGVAKR
ncbi:MAG TPA: DUF748 domain-containing protein [Thiobacillaceae bacterium]|nr:DUF748 domain-containing protein [Thiobacillaceae bacterium]